MVLLLVSIVFVAAAFVGTRLHSGNIWDAWMPLLLAAAILPPVKPGFSGTQV